MTTPTISIEDRAAWIARIRQTIRAHSPQQATMQCKTCGVEITDPFRRQVLRGFCSTACLPRQNLSAREIAFRNSLADRPHNQTV